ncbi:MAG: hypothetical protein ACR2KK_09295 [Acidimicrobiales bacterium]
MAEEERLDAEASAQYLGLPTRLVYSIVKANQLGALRFPVRVRRSELPPLPR